MVDAPAFDEPIRRADERRLEMRNQGHDRSAIAAGHCGAEVLSRRLSRALDRIAAQSGLDDAP